jgi:ELWxxDGT repeat protein
MTQRDGELLYVVQSSSSNPLELWSYQDAEDRRLLSLDVSTGIGSPADITIAGDEIYVADGEGGIWKTDGTPENTNLIRTFASTVSELLPVDGKLFFVADDAIHGKEVWVTDGTSTGTELAADVRPGPRGSSPAELTVSGDAIFFSADDGRVGSELWKIELSLVGDIDGDGLVGFSDFLIVSENFGSETEEGSLAGDLDQDGVVDFSDFLLVSSNFGKARP